jgi:hypothetical protein
MNWYNKVKQFVDDSFAKAGDIHDLKHFDRTVHWLLQLDPHADDALQTAAYAHDIERAFRDKSYNKIFQNNKGFISQDHLRHHQETGADIISDFLTQASAPEDFIKKVKRLISRHEIGGNADENILKDADSISYFENQIPFFLEVKVKSVGKDKVREKFDWMFSRISSSRAKQLAEPMYLKAIKDLQ